MFLKFSFPKTGPTVGIRAGRTEEEAAELRLKIPPPLIAPPPHLLLPSFPLPKRPLPPSTCQHASHPLPKILLFIIPYFPKFRYLTMTSFLPILPPPPTHYLFFCLLLFPSFFLSHFLGLCKYLIGSPISSSPGWSHSIFISPTFSAPTFQGQIMHKIAHFTSFLHLFAREIYVCLSLLTLGVWQKESESRFSFKHGGKHFDKFFLEGEIQKSVALRQKHITLSMWAGWCPLPLLSWWRYCVFWQKRFKILRLVTISGQNQAYAQAALQYAYAPNMLTAQQLTAAGLSYLLSFKMCLGCLYSVVFRNIIARPKRPYPCPSLPSILGLTSPGFPAYAAAAGSNKFHETQLSHTIWNLDTSFCGHKWICLPGPAPAGQANPQQQPAEQRIQWEGGENFFYIFARRKETIIYGLSLFPGHVQYRIGRIWKEK